MFEPFKALVSRLGYDERAVCDSPLPIGVSEETVRQLLARGLLHVTEDGRLRISRAGFREFCRMLG